ncbi:MAG: sulfotransferase family 2 domain-containing protein [Rhodospirillaceae bacterium]
MILSLAHNFLFIHVYKVAGTSIVHALGKTDIRKSLGKEHPRTMSLYLRCSGVNPRLVWMHDHALAKNVRPMMRRQTFDSLYKVGFVRNPWDLQLSLYKYNLKFPELQVAKQDFSSFESFVMSAPDDEFPMGQQKRFLFDDEDNQLVDFIGRYENLEQDFRTVCSEIGMDDVTLEHRNATEHAHWSTYYTREMFDKVRRHAKADIEAFGYPDDPTAYAIH